ncbi:hypothetical protein DQ354_08005 [Arthrobacter sp. AQ5-06]|nr:hypothetical protein DQ354_08005 [Arthrobacter sp. AQ5-06]
MSYDFHLVAATDPRQGDFAKVCTLLEDRCSLEQAGDTGHLILTLGGEQLALISTPSPIENDELLRVFGQDVARQLRGTAWVSEVNCPEDKDTAEAARTFLMLAVAETRGVVIDPQSNELLNALDQ